MLVYQRVTRNKTSVGYLYQLWFHCNCIPVRSLWCRENLPDQYPFISINISFNNHYSHHYLVGGWPIPLKNMSSSIGMIIPNIWKNKIHVPKHQPEIEWTTLDSFPSPSLPGHPPKNHSLPRCGRPRAPPGGRGAWDGRVVAHLRTLGNGKLTPVKWRNPTYPPSNYWVKGNSCWFGLIRFDGLLWWVISRDLTTVIR